MDAPRFDALTRAMARPGSRRGLLALLLSLPGLSSLFTLLAPDEAGAKGRRKRRKKRHKHGRPGPRHRHRRKKCKRKSRAKICAGKCGIVKNRKTCKKKVNCGTCACDPLCPVCQTCQAGPTTPGACVPDAALNGRECGEPGEECQDGACVQTCTVQPTDDLAAAIAATPAGGTLRLCAGDWHPDAAVHIDHSLTLRGVGAGRTSLKGRGPEGGRVLTIAGEVEVTLQDLTVTEGEGGIVNAGELTLRDVTVTSNTTGSGGGGIYNVGTLTLQDGARVASNTAGNGGGIRNDGGTVTLETGSVVGGDESGEANVATTSGGGIFNASGMVILETGSRVTGNTASDDGGGIANIAGGTVVLEDDSRVAGNAATDAGGGIYNGTGGLLTLLTGSRVAGNEADRGGGIFNNVGMVTVQPGAFVCDNLPHDDQCAGTPAGTCPSPAGGTCPAGD